MATTFLTGGSGFIGGRLIERLVQEGSDVRAVARSERAAERVASLGAEAVHADLAEPDALRRGADGCELAFHAAARVEDWGPWEKFERDTVRGTRNVVDACTAAGVRRLVHVGT